MMISQETEKNILEENVIRSKKQKMLFGKKIRLETFTDWMFQINKIINFF